MRHRLLAPSVDWDSLETAAWLEYMEPDVLYFQLMGIDPDLYMVDMENPLSLEDTFLPEGPVLDLGFIKIADSWFRLMKRS